MGELITDVTVQKNKKTEKVGKQKILAEIEIRPVSLKKRSKRKATRRGQ